MPACRCAGPCHSWPEVGTYLMRSREACDSISSRTRLKGECAKPSKQVKMCGVWQRHNILFHATCPFVMAWVPVYTSGMPEERANIMNNNVKGTIRISECMNCNRRQQVYASRTDSRHFSEAAQCVLRSARLTQQQGLRPSHTLPLQRFTVTLWRCRHWMFGVTSRSTRHAAPLSHLNDVAVTFKTD